MTSSSRDTSSDRYLLGRLYGPANHLAPERERLAGLTWNNFGVKRLGSTIGAEITGINICEPLLPDVVEELRQALFAFKVIFFRNQPLTAAQHVAFGRSFGDLEIHPFTANNNEHPELVRFEKSVDVKGIENFWHHDVTWRECPSMGAILHAIKVPETGGDTLFSDSYAAYEGLPDDVKERIEHLDVEHSFVDAFRNGIKPEDLPAMEAKYPRVIHPLVARHPFTGRKHLLANPSFGKTIIGMDPDAGEELMKYLWSQSDRPEYQVRWHWEKDSVAFWDNRGCQHYASSDYWPDVRIMERASIIGPRPTR